MPGDTVESDTRWDRANYAYDQEHGDPSGASWAKERLVYAQGEARRKGRSVRGGETEMDPNITPHDRAVDRRNGHKAVGSTWKNHRSKTSTKRGHRKERITPRDRRIDSQNGRKAAGW